MKNINTNISIISNTNRIVSASGADWGSLRQNTNIIIGNDKIPYTIAEFKKFFYIKNFTTVDEQVIKIEDSIKANLLSGDKIDLSYKEFYAVEIDLDNEAAANEERIIEHEQFIEPIKISLSKGSNVAEIIDGGKSLAKIEQIGNYKISYNEFSDRKIIQYEIVSMDLANSTLLLNKIIPRGVKEGKISTQKWEAFLNTNYMGHDRLNVQCHISRGYTKNLQLPTVPQFGPAQSAVLNDIFKKLDAEIQEIKNKVGL